MTSLLSRRLARLVVSSMLPLLTVGLGPARAVADDDSNQSAAACQLNSAGGDIKHVISITFDNTHFMRDNPNVPSDLELMPNLLNFMKDNGTVLTNYHTPLISHTATDILTSLTGVYGDRHGVPVSNTFRYFKPGDQAGNTSFAVAFAYWTSPIFDPTPARGTNTKYNMLTAEGNNAPAPWVPYTRAGCDFGAVSTANIVLENISIDIPTVFEPTSAEAAQVAAEKADPANRNKPDGALPSFADYVGIAVHCAKGSSLCSAAHNGKPDKLPDEPGGYQGYNGLFGHKYVAPQISDGDLKDLNGNPIQNLRSGRKGFPGFDSMPATVSLGYVAAMQEQGIPVTYAYITDSHDRKTLDDQEYSYGPGEAGYVANLKANDEAFGKFFARLASAGINKSNTLFVFTSDEGDHFAGVQKTNCNGVTTTCVYHHDPQDPVKDIGEVNGNLAGLLATQKGITTDFTVHSDVAPTFYIKGNPAPDNPTTRAMERAVGTLQATNPYTGITETITQALADPVEMKLLHMITSDRSRTPTFTMFAQPDYFLFAAAKNCNSSCISINPKFAWNHGTFSPDITTTWLGLVGPGVKSRGIDSTTWSDHADLRPTTLSLLGLRDDYSHQGRVLVEAFDEDAAPESAASEEFVKLAQAYKQINAPVGQLSLDSLKISTRALNGNDATYGALTAKLVDITSRRDALAVQMESLLEGAAFFGREIDDDLAEGLVSQAMELLRQVRELAA